MRLVARIFLQTMFALAFFVGAFFLFEAGGAMAMALGWGAIALGILVLAQLVIASAYGRLRTPEDFGAGFVVPPHRPRRWYKKEASPIKQPKHDSFAAAPPRTRPSAGAAITFGPPAHPARPIPALGSRAY